MQLHIPDRLSFGCCPGSASPPALCGAFFAKATFELKHDAPLAWADAPEPVSGDRYGGPGSATGLVYPSDFALFKPRADVIVISTARNAHAGIDVGAFSKTCDGPAASLGPVPASAPQRQRLTGRDDDPWSRRRWPWLAQDFDCGYFNAAPRDQQIDGHLRGDEELTLRHLRPAHPLLRTRLPGLRLRCVLAIRAADGGLRRSDLRMRLDTLWIDADAGRLVLVWRGMTRILTPRMREVQRVAVATEALAEEPRPAAEYLALEDEAARPAARSVRVEQGNGA